MAINLFPQLQFNLPSGSYGGGGGGSNALDGVQLALGLESLKKAKADNQKQEAIEKAKTASMKEVPVTKTTEQGLTVNVGNKQEFDQEAYLRNLEQVDPAIAQQYKSTVMANKQAETEYQQKKQLFQLENYRIGMDLIKAGRKEEGISLLNQFADPGEEVADMIPGKNGKMIALNKNGTRDEVDINDHLRAVQSSRDLLSNTWNDPEYNSKLDAVIKRNPVTNNIEVLHKFDRTKKAEELTPYEKKSQELGALKYTEAVAQDQKLAQKETMVDDALSEFVKYSKTSKFGTGAIGLIPGITQADKELQAVDRKFKALNLEEMVTAFQGMSRAVDSDAERKFFEQKQPSISNDDLTNSQILVGAQAMTIKQKAENAALKKYITEHQTADGYVSPVINKQEVVFNSKGPRLVPSSEVKKLKKEGYRTADEQAKYLLSSKEKPSTKKEKVINWDDL